MRAAGAPDQRRSPRIPFRVAALIVGRDDDEDIEVVTRDISVGGVFVELAEPTVFFSGQSVFVWLRFPGEELETPLAATVRWIGADGLGLQFQPMGARETHAITKIVGADVNVAKDPTAT